MLCAGLLAALKIISNASFRFVSLNSTLEKRVVVWARAGSETLKRAPDKAVKINACERCFMITSMRTTAAQLLFTYESVCPKVAPV